jgi:hypothetical protein
VGEDVIERLDLFLAETLDPVELLLELGVVEKSHAMPSLLVG